MKLGVFSKSNENIIEKFKNAKWIWYTETPVYDSYGDFVDCFNYEKGKVTISISCDGDYTLFINNKFVSSNQYGDFENYKIFDTIDVTNHLICGENKIYILVWHFGINTSRYKFAPAGLIYSVECDGEVISNSSVNTKSRENPNFKSNYQKMVTIQFGQSFLYDATKPDNTPYSNSYIVNKNCNLFPRPIQKSFFLDEKKIKIIKNEDDHFLIDLGEEVVGVPVLRFTTKVQQKITLAWGEHIIDGEVRRIIGDRDFSFEYIAQKGENRFTNYMFRLGCRYIELYCEAPIELDYAGIMPQVYPLEAINKKFENNLDQQIYDSCVNTLKLCIMEHYVDTPWREQSLYAFDSRNQMLCGYKAFKNQNSQYARANLLLISNDRRKDDLLSITFPSGTNLAIPSFSLYYFLAVKEYIEATGDSSLGVEVYNKLLSILKPFLNSLTNGLINKFNGADYWHFYDWSDHMYTKIGQADSNTDFMINALLVLALESFKYISIKIDKIFEYQNLIDNLKSNIKTTFYNQAKGLFTMRANTEQFTELCNSMAILAGISTKEESEFIAKKLLSGELTQCSLSMKCFKYDALLMVDKKYHKNIVDEIRSVYKPMLESNSTSVWEVAEGANAFDKAGSLCHGWSSMPIIYLE